MILCQICNTQVSNKSDIKLSKKYATNIHLCKVCLDGYLLHKVVIGYICTNCGDVYSANNRMFRQRKNKGYIEPELFYCKSCFVHINVNRVRQTMIDRYGGHAMQTTETKNKHKQTMIDRYGGHAMQTTETKNKHKQTMIDRYGEDNAQKVISIKEKTRETNKIRYGGHPMLLEHVIEKYKNSMFTKYGVHSPMHISNIHSRVAKSSIISKLEKKVYVMLKNRNIQFIHQYTLRCESKIHAHTFDFAIFNDDALVALVDCDGLYYHGYNSDIHTYERDDTRTLCVPRDIQFHVIFENDVEGGFQRILHSLNINYDNYIKDIFDLCRCIEFPYPLYTKNLLERSYRQLCTYNSFSEHKSQIGNKLITHFHRSIYHANRKNHQSPYNAWINDELLLNAIKNRFIYSNRLDPSRMLGGFSVSKIAPKVSIFRATLAKQLINKYLADVSIIFDPFSGFSGRMLGCCATGRQYIGQDINSCHVHESNKIIEFLNLNATVVQQDILTDETKEYESLFTCSPYTDKEQWNQETVYKSCDEWIDICMEKYKCKKYLFVVDETTKYKDYIVEEIINKSHFGSNKEYVLSIIK